MRADLAELMDPNKPAENRMVSDLDMLNSYVGLTLPLDVFTDDP